MHLQKTLNIRDAPIMSMAAAPVVAAKVCLFDTEKQMLLIPLRALFKGGRLKISLMLFFFFCIVFMEAILEEAAVATEHVHQSSHLCYLQVRCVPVI